MNPGFQSELRVETIDDCNWKILEDFSWVGSFDDPLIFTVYAGEKTDFATVPWWTQSILPRTGRWSKAAVLHDKMCNQLNEYYDLMKEYETLLEEYTHKMLLGYTDLHKPIEPVRPRFTSVQTDAIFYKNARDGGTDRVRSELLWFGVRCGALSRPRRDEWWLTFPRWFLDLVLILLTLFFVTAGISFVWPW